MKIKDQINNNEIYRRELEIILKAPEGYRESIYKEISRKNAGLIVLGTFIASSIFYMGLGLTSYWVYRVFL